MIIDNSISLMDENYFNFQMEMINLESSFTFYNNCIEYTDESENIFIKIKNGIINFFKKVVNFINKHIKKDLEKINTKNKKYAKINDVMQKTLNNKEYERTYPIKVEGEDNEIFGNMDLLKNKYKAIDKIYEEFNTIFFMDFMEFEKDAYDNKISYEELKNKYSNLLPDNINDAVNEELKDCKDSLSAIRDKKNFIKLTPGGEISSEDEYKLIVRISMENTQNEKFINELNNCYENLELYSEKMVKEIYNLKEPELEKVKLLSLFFTYIQKKLDTFLEIFYSIKIIICNRFDTVYSIIDKLNENY